MTKKKWLSVLLAVVLVAALLPTTAFAAEAGTAKDFIAAVDAGGTVTLTADITLTETQRFTISGKTVEIDLNGFALTREGENSNALFTISNNGSLTVGDSKGGGTITSSYPFKLMSNSKFVLNGGVVTSPKGSVIDIYSSVSNVLVEMNGGSVSGAADNTFGIRGKSNVVVNINGGTVSAVPGNRLAMYISGDNDDAIKINMTGGTIEAQSQAVQAYSGAVINVSGDAKIHSQNGTAISTQSGYGVVELNVTGGSITTDSSYSGYAVYARESSVVNIEGGTVSGGTAVCAYDNANVQISGGDITGKSAPVKVSGTPTVDVTGGTFNKDVSAYADEDAALATVTSGGATKYVVGDTIAKEAAKAGEGDQITVTKGSVDLTNVADGVIVSNSGSGNVNVNGEQVTEEPVTAHTHTYGEPVWTWTDVTAAEATFTCTKDPTHTATEPATITSEVTKEATCTEKGETTYTAKVTFGGAEYTDEKVAADVEMIAHTLEATAAKEATCTEDGNIAYWTCETCKKIFADEKAEKEITAAETVIKATDHKFENGVCTVCGAEDPDYEAPAAPAIIKGANGTWNKDGKEGLSFTSDAEYADFLKAMVDGKDLDKANYEVKEGSTIVTLKPAYLETLEVGKHTLEIVSANGTAKTEFTVTAAQGGTDDTDKDDTNNDETNKDEPQTGDNANFLLWVSLIVVSMVGACATVIYTKQGKHSKR